MAVASILSAVLFIFLAIFISLPPPPLSPALQSWKERGKHFQFKSFKIFYVDEEGTGKDTLVCLHGFPTFSYDWIKILPGLKEQFSRVIMLDFLGFGFSEKPGDHDYRIAEQADIVEALLQKLNIPNTHLLSHDYGDTVALELLARFNSRENSKETEGLKFTSLSMLNGGVFPETHRPRLLQKVLLYPVLGPVFSRLMFYRVFKKGFGEIFGTNKPSEEEYKDFWAGLLYDDGNIAMPNILQFLPERQANKDRWVGALKQTAIPVQMIYGPADPVNPPIFADHFRKTVPQHTLVDLGHHVGHYPQWEAPEQVIHAYRQFVMKVQH